jgi:hypothetical protein
MEAGTASQLEAAALERELAAMERTSPPGWAWLLALVGFALMIGLAAHAWTAYVTIDRIDEASHIATSNPVLLLQDLGVNGPRVPATIDANSRGAYGRALAQYLLDGTGVCLGFALAFAGLFIRINR